MDSGACLRLCSCRMERVVAMERLLVGAGVEDGREGVRVEIKRSVCCQNCLKRDSKIADAKRMRKRKLGLES